jgi:hypothetical protein
MEMKQELHIKTTDAEIFFKITVGKKTTLFDAAMRKVAILQSMARHEKNIYAFIHLAKSYQMINVVLMTLDEQMKRFKKVLEKKIGDISKIKFSVKKKIRYEFSNAVHGALLQVIEKLDDCLALIALGKNKGFFIQQDTFFNLKNSLKEHCFRLLSQLIQIKTRDMPKVTISHYLSEDKICLVAAERAGVIDPQVLYQAICSSVTPDISKKELNRIAMCLQSKMNHAAKIDE